MPMAKWKNHPTLSSIVNPYVYIFCSHSVNFPKQACLSIAKIGLEPTTFSQWDWRATTAPLRQMTQFNHSICPYVLVMGIESFSHYFLLNGRDVRVSTEQLFAFWLLTENLTRWSALMALIVFPISLLCHDHKCRWRESNPYGFYSNGF